ncbi:glycosyltransferase family 4 protein [Prosthecomicrobium sp. N25]|uniref:glycosyltransferase family 4 protein n=1 Tax=Prosthecomicrobium sp. N25 TaxID=3129254 RepID=UPI00307696BB
MARVLVIASLASSLVNFRGPLLQALQQAGHEVHTMAPDSDPATLAWLGARAIPFHEIPMARQGLAPHQDLATLLAMAAVMRRIRPDATLAYTMKPVVYGTLAARLTGVKRRYAMITGLGFAFTEAGQSWRRVLARRIASGLLKAALARLDAIVFQNPDDPADLIRLGVMNPDLPTTIVNGSGVDLDHFAVSPLPPEPRFVMVGRVIADKGVVEYIEAARAIRAAHPEARFQLVGPIETGHSTLPKGLLESAVADGVIDYPGETRDVRPAVAAASVFVLPSYREGTPRAVLEAMSMGRPIITTDAPGCREPILDGVNGFMVPVRDVPALTDAMAKLIRDPELRARMGRESRRIAEERYEAKAVAASVLKAFDL